MDKQKRGIIKAKKLICSNCKEQIEDLAFDVTATCSGIITQDKVFYRLLYLFGSGFSAIKILSSLREDYL
jgi:hypothetical protein